MKQEENLRLCQIGPGTPMGKVFRSYWLPICLSSEIPEPDGPPKSVEFLGERFVVFRDTLGRVGVLDEACSHRGASLALGRVEDCGIRCIFHGWKFSVDGGLMDAPNVRNERFRDRMKARSHPCRDIGGFLWVHAGQREFEPDFPHYAYMDLPPENWTITRVELACNWLQVLEGSLDSSHLGILHGDYSPLAPSQGRFDDILHETEYGTHDNAPRLAVERTDFGLHYAALRDTDTAEHLDHIRIAPYVLPSTVAIAGGFFVIDVPINDTMTAFNVVHFNADAPVEPALVDAMVGADNPQANKDGRIQMSRENNFLQDRSTMAESFSGIAGLNLEDFAVSLSMGPLVDRSNEHLVPADLAVSSARRLLLDCAATVEAGGDPPGVRLDTDPRKIAAREATLPVGADWRPLVEHHVPAKPR